MSDIKSGSHLRAMRGWIQRNAHNGETVTWGSQEFVKLKPQTIRDFEMLAQQIRDAVEEELRPMIEELEHLAYIGEHHFPDATYKSRLEEIVPLHRDLRIQTLDVLEAAVSIIRQWHGMSRVLNTGGVNEAWRIYYNHAPAMKTIREAIDYLRGKTNG